MQYALGLNKMNQWSYFTNITAGIDFIPMFVGSTL